MQSSQNHLQSNNKNGARQLQRIHNQNIRLEQELQDIKQKYLNLKKEHQIIWQGMIQHNSQNTKQINSKQTDELNRRTQQFVSIVKQKQFLQDQVNQLRQKIDDLKYTNYELKQMNQKQQRIHQKQIQILSKSNQPQVYKKDSMFGDFPINNNQPNQIAKYTASIKQFQRKLSQSELKIDLLQDQVKRQKQQNVRNQQKLQKCSQITKQMQQYYTAELQSKETTINQLQNQITQYCSLQSPHPRVNSRIVTSQECSSLKCSSVVSEYQNNNFTRGQNIQHQQNLYQVQQRYQQLIQQMRQDFDRQLSKYQDKVRYLIVKVQSLQAEKKYLQNSTLGNEQSIQFTSLDHFNNKIQHSINLKLSKASNSQSISNFTPKSQFSCSVQSINQREVSIKQKVSTCIKTPNKSLQKYSQNTNRNSGQYRRVPLNQINCGY